MLLCWAFAEIQREKGESVYFRLSTRPVEQPKRKLDPELAEAIVAGGYWLRAPGLTRIWRSSIAARRARKRSPPMAN